MQQLLQYNNNTTKLKKNKLKKRSIRYKQRRKVPKRACKQIKHKLFTQPKPGNLFTCHPNDQKGELNLDSSVLHLPAYRYTKPDSEFIFEEEDDDDAYSDTMAKVTVKSEDHS